MLKDIFVVLTCLPFFFTFVSTAVYSVTFAFVFYICMFYFKHLWWFNQNCIFYRC